MKLLQNNIFFSWWSLIIDRLTQFGVFRWIPKRIFAYIIILLLFTGLLCLSTFLFDPPNDPPVNQLRTMCTQCGHREIMNLIIPESGVCSKCTSKIGYAWQCDDCGKYFPKLDTEKAIVSDPKLSKLEKIALLRPQLCPHCRSSKVYYVSRENATFGYQ